MAVSGQQEILTMKAAVDLSGKRYHLIRSVGTRQCNQASQSTDSGLLGVLQNKPESGEQASIADRGDSKLVVGASIAANTYFSSNSSGRAVAVASGLMTCGRTYEAAGGDGDIISARLFPPVRWSGAT